MSELVIKIPDKLNQVFACEDFLCAVPYESLAAGTRLILNMEAVSFINPYGMLLLALAGKHIHQRTKLPAFLVNIRPHIYKYLERMNFWNYVEGWFFYSKTLENYDRYDRNPWSVNLIEMMPITLENKSDDIYRVTNEFREHAEYILGYWLHRVDVDKFVTVISEVCQNIFMHSESIGYVALQTYQLSGKDVVNLAVCDMGIGIKSSLNKQFPNFRLGKTSDYIWRAFFEMPNHEERFHYGLSEVRNIVKEWGGFVFARSDDGTLYISPDYPAGTMRDNRKFFPGTQIMIWLSN